MTDDPAADPTSAYAGEAPTLLAKAAELAEHAGAAVPTLAEALRLNTADVRDLVGAADQRPALRLISGTG